MRTFRAFSLFASSALAAHAGPILYTVTNLGSLPGGGETQALAINNAGQITGQSGNYAFLYSNGVMTAISPQLGDVGFAINGSGQVTGYVAEPEPAQYFTAAAVYRCCHSNRGARSTIRA